MTISLAPAAAETVPLPNDAASGSSQSAQISAMACPTAGYCSAVGLYDESSPPGDALLESESAGVWSATAANLPNASPTQSPVLDSVACSSAGNCVAVGYYTDENGLGQGLIETESNGQWSASEAPLTGVSPDANPSVQLDYVSCPAAGDCVAVGNYDDFNGDQQGLIETESNGVWSASEVTQLPATAVADPTVTFDGLSCSSVGNCAAVGAYYDSTLGGYDDAMIDTETAGSWTVSQPNLSNLGASSSAAPWLASVSCPSDGNCTAVGYFEQDSSANSPYEGLLVNEAGGVWQPATAAQLPANASTTPGASIAVQADLNLNSVSCASAGNCTAVGSYDATSANDVDPIELTETNGAWVPAAETALPGDAAADPEGSLDSVACLPGNCVVTGTYENSSSDNSVVVIRQAAGTSSMASVDQSTGYGSYLQGASQEAVSCAADGYCAVGSYTTDLASGNSVPYILDAPAAPSIPSASVSGTQATVSWTAPSDNGGLPVSAYTVTATDLTDTARGGESVSVGATTTGASVPGLTAGDTYRFVVSASSLLGVGLSATSASVAVPAATTATSTTTTTTTAVKPTRAQLLASLKPLLAPSGRLSRLPRLAKAHSYKFTYHALEAGRVTVRWYQITGRGKHKHKLLVASGAGTAHGAGVVRLTVHLTAKGRRLVAAGHRLKLTAVVSFAGGGLTVSRTRGFTLS